MLTAPSHQHGILRPQFASFSELLLLVEEKLLSLLSSGGFVNTEIYILIDDL